MPDEQTERIAILLQARDRDFQRAMDRNNKLIARFAKQAERDTTQAAKGIEGNLSRISSTIGTAFKGFIALEAVQWIAQLGQAARAVVGDLAEIADSAKRAGVSVEALQQLRYVADQNGIDIAAVTDGLRALSLRADEFATTGGGPAAGALKELGIGAEDLAQKLKDPSELMLEIIGRMEGLSEASQIRIAADVFGRAGGAQFVQMLAEGEDGIRAMMERASDLGLVLDEDVIARAAALDDRFAEVTARIGNLFQRFTVGAADFAMDVAGMDGALDGLFEDRGEATALLGEGVVDALEAGGDAAVDAAAGTVAQIDAIYGDMADRVRGSLGALDEAAILLRAWGETGAADALSSISQEMLQLAGDIEDGTVSADEFEARLAALTGQAQAALGQLSAIDSVQFAGAIGALGGLQNALAGAVQLARTLRAALPGSTFLGTVAPDVRYREDPRGNTGNVANSGMALATPEAPAEAPRPAPRPAMVDDYSAPDGGWGGAPATFGGGAGGGGGGGSSGGGGGGGGGAARLSEYQREVKSTQDAVASLTLEAAELMAVAQGGRDVGDALDYARKRADLLRAAQESGRELTPELRAEVDALALAYVTAGEAAEDAADRLRLVEENAKRGADRLTDLFWSIADGSTTAKEALAGLLMQMAEVQFQNGLSRLGEGGGAGGIFGLIGGLLSPTKRAVGGGVAGGTPYRVNEGTGLSEVFVPSRSGAILNVPQAQAAMRDAARGASQGSTATVRLLVPPGVTVEEVDGRAAGIAIEVVRQNNERLAQSQRRSG